MFPSVTGDALSPLQIHFGVALGQQTVSIFDPWSPELWWIPQTSPEACGIWVHLVNLFEQRDVDADSGLGTAPVREHYQEDLRWHWIFPRIAESRWTSWE